MSDQFAEFPNFLAFVFDDPCFQQADHIKVRPGLDGRLNFLAYNMPDTVLIALEGAWVEAGHVAEPLSLSIPEYDEFIETHYIGHDLPEDKDDES